MASILSSPLLQTLVALCLCAVQTTVARTVTYDFNISWVAANPDGFSRPTIGINGHWPPPTISADLGDTVVVNVVNALGNQSTSLHFHGLFMNGSSELDGPAQVNQCPITPGSTFTYQFKATQPGLYWYHSHVQGQYPDGLRGPLLIRDPDHPYRGQYDEELLLSVSDWYHDEMALLVPKYLHGGGMMSQEPVPDANLLNDTQNLHIPVIPERTYLVRLVNMAAFAGQYFWIEDHSIKIIEVDGVYTKPAETAMIYLSSGQRCSFLVTTQAETHRNYPMVASMDPTLSKIRSSASQNVTGWLVYAPDQPLPQPQVIDSFDPFDDVTLEPYDEMSLLPRPDQSIVLSLGMSHAGGIKWFFNKTRYAAPEIPSLYTALSSGPSATNDSIYGSTTNPFVLQHNSVVEIILYNHHMVRHPFHLHGHNFQAVYRSAPKAGSFFTSGLVEEDYPRTPIRRDTLLLEPGGFMVLRFRADNPGVWLFHCHMEWHVETGLVATLIEAPLELQLQHRDRPLPAISCSSLESDQKEQQAGVPEEEQHEPTPESPESTKATRSSMISTAVLMMVVFIVAMAGLTFTVKLCRRKRGTSPIQPNSSAMPDVEQERLLESSSSWENMHVFEEGAVVNSAKSSLDGNQTDGHGGGRQSR
ncbi:Iron transport multicopper oxidase FET3 [Fonsecaea pedrosoi]|nr:Iron transport multicopper oxidase FET3 [Fonsecaea pedrosoi]